MLHFWFAAEYPGTKALLNWQFSHFFNSCIIFILLFLRVWFDHMPSADWASFLKWSYFRSRGLVDSGVKPLEELAANKSISGERRKRATSCEELPSIYSCFTTALCVSLQDINSLAGDALCLANFGEGIALCLLTANRLCLVQRSEQTKCSKNYIITFFVSRHDTKTWLELVLTHYQDIQQPKPQSNHSKATSGCLCIQYGSLLTFLCVFIRHLGETTIPQN